MDKKSEALCPECGAPSRDGKSCPEQYQALLALEFEDPEVFGAVHHLTVLCYNLQHPSGFSAEALEWSWDGLEAAAERGLQPSELRAAARLQFNGPARVRSGSEKGLVQRLNWPMTVADVYQQNPEGHPERVLAWARAILAARAQGRK